MSRVEYVDLFNKGEIALDHHKSSREDIERLSMLCPSYQNVYGAKYSLYDYAYCGVMEYEFVLFDARYKVWNAYKGDTAAKYKTKYPVMTAKEILDDIEITERDLTSLLK